MLASCVVASFNPKFKWRTSATGKGMLPCTKDYYDLIIENLQHACVKKPNAAVYIEIHNLVHVYF